MFGAMNPGSMGSLMGQSLGASGWAAGNAIDSFYKSSSNSESKINTNTLRCTNYGKDLNLNEDFGESICNHHDKHMTFLDLENRGRLIKSKVYEEKEFKQLRDLMRKKDILFKRDYGTYFEDRDGDFFIEKVFVENEFLLISIICKCWKCIDYSFHVIVDHSNKMILSVLRGPYDDVLHLKTFLQRETKRVFEEWPDYERYFYQC